MAEGQGFFEFRTNIDAIAAQITAGLDQIVQSTQRAAGSLAGGQSGSTSGFLSQLRTQIETEGKAGIAEIERLGVQYRDAYAKAFGPGGGGAAAFSLPGGKTFQVAAQEAVGGILGRVQGSIESSVRNMPAGAAASGVTAMLNDSVALVGQKLGAVVGGVTSDLRRMEAPNAPFKPGTAVRESPTVGANIQRDVTSSFESLGRSAAAAALAAAPEAVAGANQFAGALTQMSRRAALTLEQQGLLLSGSLGRGPLAGLVTREAPNAYSFTSPSQQPFNIINGRVARTDSGAPDDAAMAQAKAAAASTRTYAVKTGDNYTALSGQEVMAQAAVNALRTNFASVEEAAQYIQQQAKMQQQLAEGEKQRLTNLENEARLQTVANDTSARATRTGSSLIFSPAAGGFVNAKGELLSNPNEIRGAYGALDQSLESQVRAAEKAAQTPLSALGQGFFGSGGRKRTGGAGDIDQQNPLNGFFETAGIVAKYELQGIAIFKMGEYARQAFTEMAHLDQATQLLNATLGNSSHVSGQFINNLENIATVAGENVVEAVKAAQSGIAAFSNSNDSIGTKEKIGQQFVGSSVQLGQITGTSLETAAHTNIAVGTSFDIGVDKLGQVANAVQVARNTFGSNNAEVMEGLRELADAGKTAGYSMNELAQIVGVVQARTAEGGTTIAQSLGRIFSLFQSKQASGFLQTVGIDTSGSVKQQIEKVAAAFTGKNPDGSESAVQLSGKQKAQLEAQLGGQRSLKELIPLLSDQVELQKAYAKAIDDSSAAQRAQDAIINSVAGQLRIFGQTLRNVALDIARSGIFAPLGLALKAVEPLIQLVDKLIQQWDRLPTIFRGAAAALLEVVAVMKIADTAFGHTAKAAIGGLVASISPSGRAARTETAALRLEGTQMIRGAAAGYAAGSLTHDAAMAQTAEGIKKLQLATEAEAAAATANAAAKAADTAATSTNTIVKTASTASEKLDSVEKSLAARREAVVTTGLVGALERFSLSVAEATVALGGLGASAAGGLVAKLMTPIEGGLFSKGGLAAIRSLPVIGTAAVVAGVDYELAKHLGGITSAERAGDKAASEVTGSTNVDELKQQAADLSKAGADIKHASAGFFGTIAGALSEAFGGVNRGAAANALKKEADALYEGANLVDQAQQKLLEKFNAGGIDFQAVDGVTTGLKNMVSQGASAADQLLALTTAMEAVASSAHGVNVVFSGQTDAVGAKVGTSVQQDFFSGLNDLAELPAAGSGSPGSGFNYRLPANSINRGADAASALRSHVDEKRLTDDLTSGMQSYFAKTLPDGGPLAGPAKMAAVQHAKDLLVQSLEKQGIDFAKLPKTVRDYLLNEGVELGTLKILNHINAASGDTPAITKDNLNAILAAAPALAKQAGQDAATKNSLTPTQAGPYASGYVFKPQTQFSSVVGAQTTLAYLQKVRSDAQQTGADKPKLDQLQNEINVATLDLQNALAQEAQAMYQLAAAMVSPFDKLGAINAQLKGVTDLINSGKVTDLAQLDQLKATQAQLKGQALQQGIENSVSGIGVGTDSRNATQVALDAMNQAKTKLDKEKKAGATGQDLNDAQKAYNNAQTAYNQSLVDSSAAQAAASANPGSPVSEAAANLAAAKVRLNGDLVGTTQWWQDYKALKDAQFQASQAQLDASKGAIEAAIIPGDKLSEAKAAIAEAKIDMQKDKDNAAAFGADLKRLHDAQYQLAEAEREIANNNELLKIDLTDPVARAKAALDDAKRKLKEDKKRGADTSGDKVDVEDKSAALAKAKLDQQLQDEQTAYDLKRISGAQYLQFLEKQDTSLRAQLAGMKKGSKGYRQLLDELNAVDQAILNLSSSLDSQFNLGDIKIPTVYDARREVAAGSASGGMQAPAVQNNNNTVTINGADFDKIKALIVSLLGPDATSRTGSTQRKA